MIMTKNSLAAISGLALCACTFTSCDTATGQGAGWGAATGAIIGAAATGNVRGAAIGAGIGAGTGALIGASIDADERGYYGGYPASHYPFGRHTDTPGVLRSPYAPYRLVDVHGVPHGALVRDPASGGIFRRP
jgi:predicted small secreted protein